MKLPLRFRRSRTRLSRIFVRHQCEIDTTITLIDRMLTFEGRVTDVSRGGALFRPRLAYIMRRSDTPMCLKLLGLEVFGTIVATSPAGFSISFDEPIEERAFDTLTATFTTAPSVAA